MTTNNTGRAGGGLLSLSSFSYYYWFTYQILYYVQIDYVCLHPRYKLV